MNDVASDLTDLVAQEIAAGRTAAHEADADLPAVDLRTLLGEMAALRAEVRAETLAARELRERLGETQATLARDLERAAAREAGLREDLARVERGAARRTATALIDAWERVRASLGQAERLARPRARWWGGMAPADAAAVSLRDGLRLTQRRLEEQIAALGIERVAAAGARFDAATMQAVETAARADAADGVVVEEVTAGWRDAAGLLRPAQVIVNRLAGAAS